MALTGEAVLIANSSKYGQNEGAPRGVDGDGTYVYVLGNSRKRLIRVKNLDTFASEYASAATSGAAIQSLAFLGGDAYFSQGTALRRWKAPLTSTKNNTALTGSLPGNVFSLTSDDTHLYCYRQNNNTIHRITLSGDDLDTFTVSAFATVTFPAGVSTNIRSFFYFKGAFYFINLQNNRLYKSPDNIVAGSTVAATQVGNFANFGASVTGIHGAGVLGDNAYIASGASDNLYRLYNVQWDAEIAAIDVDEGEDTSLDLSGVSQDATSFEFAPSHTTRSWLTLSGTNLVITNAPAVATDTDFQAVVRAVRGSVHEDKTLTVTVRDTTPRVPSAPQNVSATDTGPTSIDVEWDAPADNGRAEIQDYEVRHVEGETAGGTWTSTGSATTSIRISSLKKGTKYTIQVRAVNAVGAGPASAAITATTDTTVPAAPQNVSATDTDPTSIDLEWDAPTDTGGAAIQDYEIRHAEGQTAGGTWTSIGSATTSVRISNLKKGTKYTIQVRAVNAVGKGPASSAITATTDTTVPSAPRNVSTTDTGPNFIDLEWDAPTDIGGATIQDYEVRHAEGQTAGGTWTSIGSTTASVRISSLKKGTKYTIQVRAVNAVGEGPASTAITVTTGATVPAAPQNVRVTGTGSGSIDLEWDAPTDTGGDAITGYAVNVAEGSTPGTTWVATGSTNTTHRITGLKPNTRYTLQVRAVNSVGASPASASVRETTDVAPARPLPTQPSAPGQVEIQMTPTTAELAWKAPTNGAVIDGYEISAAEGSTPGTEWVATESTQTRAMVKGLKRQTAYTFRVRARNTQGAGLESAAMTQTTPIASLHNALFFKECVNYLDNGGRVSVHGDPTQLVREVADNDYKTSTTEKDLDINIAVSGGPTRVDAIFVKGIGIEGHSAVPTGGSGSGYSNRRMPETVKNWEGTDVSTVVNGFQHDLYLLDDHFTATSVRLTFTGTNAKIVEVMLLEFGISIDANGDFTEIATNFVDREGIIHSDPGGGIVYDPPIGGERDKWEVTYTARVVPGKTILETPEAFLYWRSENRNHVFCMEPSRFPWRIFPAVFVGKSVPVRYRTDDKTAGEIINFRVAEQ